MGQANLPVLGPLNPQKYIIWCTYIGKTFCQVWTHHKLVNTLYYSEITIWSYGYWKIFLGQKIATFCRITHTCARSIKFVSVSMIFLLDFGTVPTVWYFSIGFWNCSNSVVFSYWILELFQQCGIFLLDFGTVPTVWYFPIGF